jgi:hypothetical protein
VRAKDLRDDDMEVCCRVSDIPMYRNTEGNDLRKFTSALGSKWIRKLSHPFVIVHADELAVMNLPAVRVQVGRKGLASEVLAGFEYDVFC